MSAVEKVETLKALDGKMEELVPDDELEERIQCADEYKEKVCGVLAKLDKDFRPTISPPPTSILLPTTVTRIDPLSPLEHPILAAEADHPVTEPNTICTETYLLPLLCPPLIESNCPKSAFLIFVVAQINGLHSGTWSTL